MEQSNGFNKNDKNTQILSIPCSDCIFAVSKLNTSATLSTKTRIYMQISTIQRKRFFKFGIIAVCMRCKFFHILWISLRSDFEWWVGIQIVYNFLECYLSEVSSGYSNTSNFTGWSIQNSCVNKGLTLFIL